MPVDFSKIPSPCFVMDEGRLRANLEIIRRAARSADAEILLALKGFAMWGIFPIIREYMHGASASSAFEARLAWEEMHVRAHTYSPAYSPSDFDEIVRYSSRVSFNSLDQLRRFEPRIRTGDDISMGLRVNPGFSPISTRIYNPCVAGSHLGVAVEDLRNGLPQNIQGLHFHALCESDAADLEAVLDAFEKRFSPFLSNVLWVNMGGGHLMTRAGYDTDRLVRLIRSFRERNNGVSVILEPGSAFAWDTGWLVATVLDVVEHDGIRTAILNVSFAAHMPDCLEMPYKPRILGASDETPGKPTYRMAGNTCMAGDVVGSWSFDRELKAGDPVIFEDMMHYTMVKTTFFNGAPHPSIGIWNDDTGFTCLRSFGYPDFKHRLS